MRKTLKLWKTAHAISKVTSIGLLSHKRANIFKFTIFMQEIVRINELLEISAFFQKREIEQKRVRNCKFT